MSGNSTARFMPATFYIATTPLSGHTAERRISLIKRCAARTTARDVRTVAPRAGSIMRCGSVASSSRPGGAGRGWVFRVSAGWSVCRGDLGDGGAGGCLVDETLAGCCGGDEGGDGDVVDGAGLAAGGLVDLGDRVVGEQVGGAARGLEVVADVAGGLVGGHALHLVADGDPLVEGRE